MATAANPVGDAGAMNNTAAQGEFTQEELDWATQALANPKKSPFTSRHEMALSEAAAEESLPALGYIRFMAKFFGSSCKDYRDSRSLLWISALSCALHLPTCPQCPSIWGEESPRATRRPGMSSWCAWSS